MMGTTSPPRPRRGTEMVTVRIGGRTVEIERRELLRRAMGAQVAVRRLELVREHHRNEANRRIMLEPQWEQIYADPAPDIRIVSAAQRGKTLRELIDTMAQLTLGLSVGWVMPKDQKVKELVQGKLNPTIRNTPLYSRLLDGASDTVHFKSFGSARLYIVTAKSESELTSFSADAMHIDERDLCDRTNLPMYPARMNASPYRLSSEISTPTVDPPRAGNGRYMLDNIASEFLTGDQHRWFVRCGMCGEWQICDFYKNVIEVDRDESGRVLDFKILDPEWSPRSPRDVQLVCAQCREPMDRLGPGEWRAMNPGAMKRSYWVEPLNLEMGPSILTLIDNFEKSINNPMKMQHFHNLDLGRTYAGGLLRFDESVFAKCTGKHAIQTQSAGPSTIGIDVNRPWLDIQITQHTDTRRIKVFAAKTRDDAESLVRLMKRYGVRFGCIDNDPEARFAHSVQDACRAAGIRLVRVKYATSQQSKPIVISEAADSPVFDPPKMITVDRTYVIDALYAAMQGGQIEWFREWREALEGKMFDEFYNSSRIYQPGEDGKRERFLWEGSPDHQMHAAVYDLLAETICGVRGSMDFEDVLPVTVEGGHRSPDRSSSYDGIGVVLR